MDKFLGCLSLSPGRRTGIAMTDTTVLTIDMAVLVGIFLMGFFAKLFPKRNREAERQRNR